MAPDLCCRRSARPHLDGDSSLVTEGGALLAGGEARTRQEEYRPPHEGCLSGTRAAGGAAVQSGGQSYG